MSEPTRRNHRLRLLAAGWAAAWAVSAGGLAQAQCGGGQGGTTGGGTAAAGGTGGTAASLGAVSLGAATAGVTSSSAAAALQASQLGLQIQQAQAAAFNRMVAADEARRQQVNAFQAARFARFVQIRRLVRARREAGLIRPGSAETDPDALTAVRVADRAAAPDRPRITAFGYGRS